jgi:hypothetical protein
MTERLIYIASGNKSKLANFHLFFSWIDEKIKTAQVPDYIEVNESGKTLADNSRLKVLPYIGRYSLPVIANDSGLFFDPSITEIQDPVKVKRNALGGKDENEFEQEEISRMMFNYYRELARRHGGIINCQMKDVFSLLTPSGIIYQRETVRDYELVDRDVEKYDLYHPLNSLRISKITSKFMDEMLEEEDKLDKRILVDALQELISIVPEAKMDQ